MHIRCPDCGLRYEREQGYFIGAMYVSYALGALLLGLLLLLVWLVTRWMLERALVAAFVLFLQLVPGIMIYSRVLWVHIDRAFDPDGP